MDIEFVSRVLSLLELLLNGKESASYTKLENEIHNLQNSVINAADNKSYVDYKALAHASEVIARTAKAFAGDPVLQKRAEKYSYDADKFANGKQYDSYNPFEYSDLIEGAGSLSQLIAQLEKEFVS